MRNLPQSTEARAEPDIIVLGRDEPGPPPRADAESSRPRRLRRYVEPSLWVLCAGVALTVVHLTGGGGPPAAEPGAKPSSSASAPTAVARQPAHRPRLLAASTAHPGERITVLAYRNRGFCGPAELRLDHAPIAHRRTGPVGRVGDWEEFFMTMELPRSMAPGRHEIELYGPISGGPAGVFCGDVPEHHGKLAGRVVTVAPAG